jgi:transposase
MLIIGCDFHPGFQQVAIFDNRTGEVQEKKLQDRAEAEQFYGSLAGQEVRVGMEACGHYPWFERLLEKLGFELRFGDAARVRASEVRKQKTDRRDAEHLLDLLRQDRSVAKVAVARKLATRLYLMLREDWTYAQLCQAVMQVSPRHSVAGE